MRTKLIEIYERSRIFRAQDSERYSLRLELYGSKEEIEKVREAVFKLEEGEKDV